MNIFVVLLIAMIVMIVLLRKKVPMGPSILTGGLLIWVCTDPDVQLLVQALQQMLTMHRTYDLIGALYFVVCLEIELRKSGCLKGMVSYLFHLIPSKKAALAAMPAFLGLLPSIGGARFSAPIVETIAKGEEIDANRLGAINFWFRHIFEFSSPIIPGMILACAIANINVGDLIIHLGWASVAAFACGWIVLMLPVRTHAVQQGTQDKAELAHQRTDFWLSIVPVLVVFVLMVGVHMSAAVSMGLVAVVMMPVLALFKRSVSLKDVFWGAMEWKLFRDVGCILFFIQLLTVNGVLDQIIHGFDGAPLPTPVILAIVSFILGILTGLSQGHVAIIMPIVAGLAPQGSLDLVGVALVFGVGGQMITPTHVCLMVTLDYFKCDFFRLLRPCIAAEALLLAVFSAVSYFTWAG